MSKIELAAIGRVVSPIASSRDDRWGEVESEIHLDPAQFDASSLAGLEEFSHVEVLFYFDKLKDDEIVTTQRHPRNNPRWPKVGIFAQRGRVRPNRIGATICELLGVNGPTLRVRGLDAFDGSPVLDLKPVMAEFLPARSTVREPGWARELMTTYF
ncbi:MAG TPA: TrmO family methyltransferase [Terriglobales bacterium]|nr:TrmO family methyltransferase [Terriglobales bacterium]